MWQGGAWLLTGVLLAASPGAVAEPTGTDQAERLFNQGNALRGAFLRARAVDASAQPDRVSTARKAIAAYSAAIRVHPRFAAAYVNRAAVHFELADYAAAIEDCTTAISLDPRLPEAFNNRSLAYHKSDRYAEAKADFDQTIRLNQNYGNAMIIRAVPDVAE